MDRAKTGVRRCTADAVASAMRSAESGRTMEWQWLALTMRFWGSTADSVLRRARSFSMKPLARRPSSATATASTEMITLRCPSCSRRRIRAWLGSWTGPAWWSVISTFATAALRGVAAWLGCVPQRSVAKNVTTMNRRDPAYPFCLGYAGTLLLDLVGLVVGWANRATAVGFTTSQSGMVELANRSC